MPDKNKPRLHVWLVHWNTTDATARSKELTAAGFDVVLDPQWSTHSFSKLLKAPPAAVIIDLSRIPSRGRDVALMIRSRKSMLSVPMLLLGGDEAATHRLRSLVSDAIPTRWPRIAQTLRKAIANPPKAAAMQSVFGAYTETPLAKKLGIREKSVVATLGAPSTFSKTLGVLPPGAKLTPHQQNARDLTLWFVASITELKRRIARMSTFGAKGGLWIIWPKGNSDGLTQVTVRAAGIAAGLVDFKISRIDDAWSGLRFTIAKRSAGK